MDTADFLGENSNIGLVIDMGFVLVRVLAQGLCHGWGLFGSGCIGFEFIKLVGGSFLEGVTGGGDGFDWIVTGTCGGIATLRVADTGLGRPTVLGLGLTWGPFLLHCNFLYASPRELGS